MHRIRISANGEVLFMSNKPPVRLLALLFLLITCLAVAASPSNVFAQTAAGNGITAPADGATASGMIEVAGVATDPAFQKWQIDLLLDGKAHKATAIAVGSEPVGAPSRLTQFDSSLYPNGNHQLRLRVVRQDGNYDEYFRAITLANPEATDSEPETEATLPRPTANGITSPDANAKVEGTVRIRGVADDPDFLKWQLDLLPGGDPTQAFLINVSRTPVEEPRPLGAVDTQYFANGQHLLRLRVVRTDSNFDEYLLPIVTDNEGAPVPRPVAENGITDPNRNARVEGVIEIHAVADAPDFDKWQVDVLVNGDPEQAIFVATGRRPVPASALITRFNTRRIPDGRHMLRLRVVHKDSNYDEYLIPIRVENPEDPE